MGQTLTHGIYLPDEGERNCYDGLASNWSILDGAVGTVAQHTSQIAGKAPLVHTHTKADITDFPAYGTTAGTICEGNDSRLSDARTPVAHTHGNIANDGKVGTTANKPLITGTGGVVQAGSFGNSANTFCEGNDSRLSDARTPVAHTHTKSDVTDLLNSNFIPSANNSYDLGSSSYQWNKIYSADVVHTSGDATITGVKTLIDYWHLQAKNLKAGEGETYGRTGYSVIFTDKNDVTMGDVTLFKNANAARTFIRIRGGDYYTNGAPAATGTLVQSVLMVGTNVSGKKIIECASDIVYPTTDNATDLGTSDNRWKSLNGVNPGALSLPNLNYSDSNQWIDLSGNITDETGGVNEYDPTVDGWVVIRANNNPISLRVNVHSPRPSARKYLASRTGVATPDGIMIVNVPAPAGSRVYIYFDKGSGSLDSATFITCQGNV